MTDQSEIWQSRFEEYLDFLRAEGRSQGTIADTQSIVSRWIDYALSCGESPEVFDEDLLEGFLGRLDLSENSRRSYTSHIRGWCQYRQTGRIAHRVGRRSYRSGRRSRHRLSAGQKVRGDIDDVGPEVWGQRFEQYLGVLRSENRSPGGIADTQSIVSRWIDYALSCGESPEVFDEDLLEGFLGRLDLSENSRRSYTSHIRGWCQYRQDGLDPPPRPSPPPSTVWPPIRRRRRS